MPARMVGSTWHRGRVGNAACAARRCGGPGDREVGLDAFRLSGWSAVAAGVGLAIALLTVGFGALLPGTSWDWPMFGLFATLAKEKLLALPVHPVLLGIPQAVFAGCSAVASRRGRRSDGHL